MLKLNKMIQKYQKLTRKKNKILKVEQNYRPKFRKFELQAYYLHKMNKQMNNNNKNQQQQYRNYKKKKDGQKNNVKYQQIKSKHLKLVKNKNLER